nr:MAG TPA: hypothetical protein [Caudoviricetes sp.]
MTSIVVRSEPELLSLVIDRRLTPPLPVEARRRPILHVTRKGVLVDHNSFVLHILSNLTEKRNAENCEHCHEDSNNLF